MIKAIRSDNMPISIRNGEIPAAACQATTHHVGAQPIQVGEGTRPLFCYWLLPCQQVRDQRESGTKDFRDRPPHVSHLLTAIRILVFFSS